MLSCPLFMMIRLDYHLPVDKLISQVVLFFHLRDSTHLCHLGDSRVTTVSLCQPEKFVCRHSWTLNQGMVKCFALLLLYFSLSRTIVHETSLIFFEKIFVFWTNVDSLSKADLRTLYRHIPWMHVKSKKKWLLVNRDKENVKRNKMFTNED